MDLDQPVSPNSFVYREVARLYRIAQSLRPTTTNRWAGPLYATTADTLGGLNPRIGALRLSADRVLPYLTGVVSPTNRRQQAQALATVLHEATHGGMHIKAPGEPNAIWTEHSRGVMEGFAEVRTSTDFELFAKRAGYAGLTFGDPQYPGAFAATSDLMAHITGPTYPLNALINDACRGPGLLHFDQFARAALANHLTELTHRDASTQQDIRAQLIEPMLHAHWPTLPATEADTGHAVAREIRSKLDAKIGEIRRDHRLPPTPPTTPSPSTQSRTSQTPSTPPPAAAQPPPPVSNAHTDTLNALRFLAAQPPPTGAPHHPSQPNASRPPNQLHTTGPSSQRTPWLQPGRS